MTIDDVIAALADVTDPRTRNCIASLRLYFVDKRATGGVQSLSRDALLDYIAFWLPEHIRSWAPTEPQRPEPNPVEVLDVLERLVIELASRQNRFDKDECLATISELRRTLPRVVELTRLLTQDISKRGGPFGFPEFLTTFEEGGRSEYDLDVAGAGAETVIEGHFRVTSVEGSRVSAVELVSERSVSPILFPEHAAPFVEPGQIATLELVLGPDGWVITDCELVFPPGTRVV